ncbi:putative F-box/FBD/LRR-repeat protein At5g56810 [Lycium ferocissimum]|uniref:putative F-box/FBD/LRR-repeat protein At5g56810 n=1 Tax=Lycium ferocissimum TaxID=112874 RepID=UPI0028163B3E|nr:putative F-box/FBD/LRR-repeat protein At5g56810 [Lycium ferocissimum]
MAAIVCDSISLPASHINRDGILSVLPEDILQQILSSLTLKQRAIASLVCKSWHQMITSLDDRKFVRTHSTKIYCGYCYYYHNNCQCSYRVEPVIKFAADNMSFTEFYLFVRSSYYYMSTQTLESSLLTVLHLKGDCNLNFVRDIKELTSLKEIYFDSVRISPDTFSKFMSKCPSMVELTLIRCYDLHSISVPHLNQLKKVHVNCRSRYIQTIEIKARNLLEFHLFISSSAAKEKLDLCACTKLQVLKIDSEYIPIGFPKDISLAFPCLKSLSLPLCKGLNKIKSLRLIDRVDLDDAFIVSPNLRSFKLIDIKKVPSSCTVAENLGENISLSLETDTTESKAQHFL